MDHDFHEPLTAEQGDEDALHIPAEASAGPMVDYSNDWAEDEQPSSRRWGLLASACLLIALFVGWTGFFAWANRLELLQLSDPARIAELIALWAIPTSLIALGWLLAMRLSSREASRFGDVAALLRTESEALKTRMRTVNGEIALARSFLAENARELESVGRSSAQKLTEAAEQLVVALADTEQKSQVLQNVSLAAVSNVELLRDHLPVVTSAAKDATNQIGNAGNAANEQLQSLIASLRTMDQAMTQASDSMGRMEQQADRAGQSIGAAASEASDALARATASGEERSAALLARLHKELGYVEQKLGEAAENIGALSDGNAQRLTEQVEFLDAAVARVSQATEVHDHRLVDVITRLNASLDGSGEKLAVIGSDAAARFDSLIEQLDSAIERSSARLDVVDATATERVAKMAFAINALSESSAELSANLEGNAGHANAMLGESLQMMEVLQGISRELGENIPTSIEVLQKGFADSHKAMVALRNESDTMEAHSASLALRMGELDQLLASQKAAVEAMLADGNEVLVARRNEVEALAASLNATHALIADVAATADEKLSGSLHRVAEAAFEAANSSKAIVESELADIGQRLGQQNRELLSGAIEAQLAGLGSAVQQAIERNLGLSEEATHRVAAQLQSINELTMNLEQRVSAAREQFDGIDDEGFARRMALLTESLNSAAIDVAKILSNEVTDTAWAAYLKGDRGVFTRRAVRLLDSGEARVIATQYDEDPEFRDHVNRYIHDFEAMMRVLLSTRDGNAIGVTLLSSDVGKLYVALAQAIDRLRN